MDHDTRRTAQLAVHRDPSPAGDTQHTLDLVRDSALRLLEGFAQPPSALRVAAHGVTIEAEWEGTRAAPHADAPPVAATAPAPAANGGVTANGHAPAVPAADARPRLTSPAVGVLYLAPEPGAEPFVSVGDAVAPGTQVAIIEVMKLMIPVEAAHGGRVAEVCRGDGEPVEYDDPLFVLDPL
ncbi:acetyl-CoA carboxylase biotin carboxyl carrier protein [Saccharothrix syringae]|uniref:Biotin carboxyl carrier protein of acetyl-CoA carboxylase n=1 Tax=Saccharothrix syringae TaxID=103733 RepID=A0A5Q0GY52_SACSY|nr:acetyl-CoA carboxylase biotin carboxyl carrier protein subunit [Saccharothrix syringae]QFZ18813.1 acetyl-CoA carboxylase biotin carboxyl carrier protein subunit [Saccharothrix syringae]